MEDMGIKITWLGHSTFILTTPEGKDILVDPWLAGNPQCPKEYHEVKVDAILITHGHGDHIGDVFTAADRCSGPIVGIYDLTSWLGTKGIDGGKLVGMNKGGTVRLEALDLNVTMTDARHSSVFVDDNGTFVPLGEAAGFVVEFSNGFRLYIAGDTSLFGDMEIIGELWEPDAAILPIGDHFTMDPRQAAFACDLLGVDAVIPCHYGTFPLLTGTPEKLERELAELELDVQVVAPAVGDTLFIGEGEDDGADYDDDDDEE